MPTAETPFEQAGELALATKWTGEPDVLPLEGELTDTPATAGSVKSAGAAAGLSVFSASAAKMSGFRAAKAELTKRFLRSPFPPRASLCRLRRSSFPPRASLRRRFRRFPRSPFPT